MVKVWWIFDFDDGQSVVNLCNLDVILLRRWYLNLALTKLGVGQAGFDGYISELVGEEERWNWQSNSAYGCVPHLA